MTTYTLPQDFFFGAAMSGPQTEGAWQRFGRIESVWDTWSNERIEDFFNRVGSYGGNDMTSRAADDYAMLRELGLTTVRTSFQWTRLLDADGQLNPEGAAYYHKMLAAAREAGVELFVNLYHFDMPTYLFRRGGWESREVVEAYAAFARTAFREFGQEVKHWFTFNEPSVEPEARYGYGFWWPFYHSFQRARDVQYGLTLAHSLAVREFRLAQEEGVVRSDARIGLISNFTPPYTREDPSPADLEAVRMTDGITNRWWLDLVTEGTLPTDVIETLASRGVSLPTRPGDEAILACAPVDWLGFNYYHPARVQAPSCDVDEWGSPVFAEEYVWPDAVINKSRGWEIYPKGIYDFAMFMTREYPDLEWFVSENGIGIQDEYLHRDATSAIEDPYRVEFVREHLAWIAKAIRDGAHCMGYHYWGAIDCWSWANAYKNRYGFIEVDLNHNYERRLKQSATWLREVTSTRRFEAEA